MKNSFMGYDPLAILPWHFHQRTASKLIGAMALLLLFGGFATGAEGVIRLPHRTGIGGIAFSADGKRLATGNLDSGCYFWDVSSGKELWRAESVEAHGLAFSPDGRTLAAAGWKGVVYLWDVKNPKTPRKLSTQAIDKDIYTLAFSPDGRRFAIGGRSNWVHLCDVLSGKVIRSFNGQGRIQSVTFSPGGTMLASATTGDRVHIWEIATGEEARPFRGKEIHGGCVAFSPEGRLLAIGQSLPVVKPDTICVHEIATGEIVRRISPSDNPRFPEYVHSLSFSPDGRALAAGGGPVVKIWGLASGDLLGKFEGHEGAVYRVCFSPDGKHLAAGGSDKTVLIWDVPSRMNKEKISSASLSRQELDRVWMNLADRVAANAYRALWDLCAVPEQAVPFLRERLLSAIAFDEKRVNRLIADLDSDQFAVRQRAERELSKMAWVVEPALRQARQKGISLEMRRRLTNLLQGIETSAPSASWLRMVRAIAVLEQVGTSLSRELLKQLADGMSELRLTREAKNALRHLDKRVQKP